MPITAAQLRDVSTGFATAFRGAFAATPDAELYRQVAMFVRSTGAKNVYEWLGQMPGMKKWVGDRVIAEVSAHGWTIQNDDWEETVRVARNDVQDNQFGTYDTLFRDLGRAAAVYPNEVLFSLFARGFTEVCYDGQYFFDTDHPVLDAAGVPQSVSNTGGGSGTAWYLLDLSREVKPFIWQERQKPELVALDDPKDENVFWRKEFVYGAEARGAAGFGLWQLAFGSKQTLDATSYEAARVALASLKGDGGRPLGIRGTHLVVPPTLEGAARELLMSERTANGATNKWRDTAELIVSPWLA